MAFKKPSEEESKQGIIGIFKYSWRISKWKLTKDGIQQEVTGGGMGKPRFYAKGTRLYIAKRAQIDAELDGIHKSSKVWADYTTLALIEGDPLKRWYWLYAQKYIDGMD